MTDPRRTGPTLLPLRSGVGPVGSSTSFLCDGSRVVTVARLKVNVSCTVCTCRTEAIDVTGLLVIRMGVEILAT